MPTPRLESLIDRLTAGGVEFVIIGGAADSVTDPTGPGRSHRSCDQLRASTSFALAPSRR